MNSVVSLPIVAAIPTAAPAFAITTDPIFAALEAFRRAEAEFYADRDGDIPDEVGDRWSRAVDAVIATLPTTPAGLVALTDFAREMAERSTHDAGLGERQWIPAMCAINDATRGMSGLEPWSPPPMHAVDAELIALCEQYLTAEQEWSRLNDISDEMDGRQDIPAPELAAVDGDADLQIPEPTSGIYGQAEIEKMRAKKWFSVTKTMEADGESFTMAVRYFEPTSAARARADEIIAAYCNWDRRSKRRPNGFRAAKRATDEAARHYYDLEDRILGTRAATLSGMIAKARLYKRNTDIDFADSIAEDLFTLAATV
jgi:hypothetical protein